MLVVSETFLSKMRHASPSGSLSISTLTLTIVTFLRTFRQYGINPSDFYLKLDEFNLSHSLNPYSLKNELQIRKNSSRDHTIILTLRVILSRL